MNTTQRVVTATNDFGFRLLDVLARPDSRGNVFISPFSIASALGMAYNGAEGETRQAMAATLGLAGLSLEEVNSVFAYLASLPAQLRASVELAIANAIWAKVGIALAPDFVRRVTQSFGGEVSSLDFAAPGAAEVVNDWTAQKTHNRIKDLVTPQLLREVIVLLVNALYFKGTWRKQFDPARTQPRPFTTANGTTKQLPAMSQSGRFSYYETRDFQAVSLPYGDGLVSMLLFLPKPSSSLDAFRQSLSASSWEGWMSHFREQEGDLILPRFKLEYGAQLKSALAELGMGVAFSPKANFTGMGSGRLKIDEVIHKTFVEVNEEGTEAAAATAVMMVRASFTPERRFSMVVSRPFFCAIRENQSGSVLFTGLVTDPS